MGVLLGAAATAGITCLAPKIWECWASRSETQKENLIARFYTEFNDTDDKLGALRDLIDDGRINGVEDKKLPNIGIFNQSLEEIRQNFGRLEDNNNIAANTVLSMLNRDIQPLRNEIRRASNNVRQEISNLRLPAPGNTSPQNPLLGNLQNPLLERGSLNR